MKKLLIVLSLFISAVCSLYAIDGREVMQMADDISAPLFSHALVRMDLIEKDGSVQSRMIEEWGQKKDGNTDLVMSFQSPASVKDTRFLVKDKGNGKNDKFIYLPSLRSTRRIAASEGSNSFMGSDASYDDMASREVDEDIHELLNEAVEKNGYTCYQVKSTPIDSSSSQYLYRISYVDHETKVPVFTESYDKKGKLLKTLTVEKIAFVSNADKSVTYTVPVSNYLINVQSGHATRMVIGKLEVDKPVSSKLFSTNFLDTGKI